jgi:hypothetical protein
MGFLKNYFGSKDEQQKELAKLQRQIDSFMRPSRALVDPRDLTIPEKRTRYAVFTFGAILGLGGDQELDETRALAILVMHLNSLESIHEREVSHLVGQCLERRQGTAEAGWLNAGVAAVREWLSGDSGDAVARLAEIMRDSEVEA